MTRRTYTRRILGASADADAWETITEQAGRIIEKRPASGAEIRRARQEVDT